MKYIIFILVLSLNFSGIDVFAQNIANKYKFYSIEDALKKAEDVKLLHLENVDIEDSEVILKFKNLRKIFFDGCKITKLPDEIDKLEKLEYIYIGHCDLDKLPVNIGNLKSLKNLSLCNIKIKELPSSLGKLKNLWMLDITYCPLGEIPKNVIKLKKLRYFSIIHYPDSSLFSVQEREYIKKNLPNCHVQFK